MQTPHSQREKSYVVDQFLTSFVHENFRQLLAILTLVFKSLSVTILISSMNKQRSSNAVAIPDLHIKWENDILDWAIRYFVSLPCRDFWWDGNGDADGVPIESVEGRFSDIECLDATFGDWSSSSLVKTSAIRGLSFGSWLMHCKAMEAVLNAPFCGYWPSSLMSIIRNNLLLSPKYGFAQSTRFCSMPTFILSTARRPDSNSSKTTPKLYTSLFAVNRPAHYQELQLIEQSR